MVCAEPLARCETLFLQPSLASTTLSALDAILADASIGAVVCQLPWAKTISIEPTFTLGALPRGTFCFLQLHAIFAVLAQSAATLFAPLMRWKLLLELHHVAPDAQRLWHVLGSDRLPIDSLAAQLLHKQIRAFCLALREQLSLEGSVDEELGPVLDPCQRHVA